MRGDSITRPRRRSRKPGCFEREGYLESDGDGSTWIVDETGERITESPNLDPQERTIEIPLGWHRNLAGLLDNEKLFHGARGKAVWTSTDGCFSGGVIVNGEETAYDLEEWAKENVLEKGEQPPDPNGDADAWFDYCEEVERAFFDEFAE